MNKRGHGSVADASSILLPQLPSHLSRRPQGLCKMNGNRQGKDSRHYAHPQSPLPLKCSARLLPEWSYRHQSGGSSLCSACLPKSIACRWQVENGHPAVSVEKEKGVVCSSSVGRKAFYASVRIARKHRIQCSAKVKKAKRAPNIKMNMKPFVPHRQYPPARVIVVRTYKKR
jgi:hypothetical protein